MALIKCPDCGKEVSENAKTCIYCGALLKNEVKQNYVFIKLTIFVKSSGMFKTANNKCIIKNENNELWSGNSGETAKIDIDSDTNLDIYVSDIREHKYEWYSLFGVLLSVLGVLLGMLMMILFQNFILGIIFMIIGLAGYIGGLYQIHLF